MPPRVVWDRSIEADPVHASRSQVMPGAESARVPAFRSSTPKGGAKVSGDGAPAGSASGPAVTPRELLALGLAGAGIWWMFSHDPTKNLPTSSEPKWVREIDEDEAEEQKRPRTVGVDMSKVRKPYGMRRASDLVDEDEEEDLDPEDDEL